MRRLLCDRFWSGVVSERAQGLSTNELTPTERKDERTEEEGTRKRDYAQRRRRCAFVGSTHIGDRFRRRDAGESEEMTSEVTKFHREDIDRYEGKVASSGRTVYNFAASVGAEA